MGAVLDRPVSRAFSVSKEMAVKNVGTYRKRGEPNQTQKDCMLLRKNCAACPNRLESQQCQTYKTPEVQDFLKLSRQEQDAYLATLDLDSY